jgi:hypothetical protein
MTELAGCGTEAVIIGDSRPRAKRLAAEQISFKRLRPCKCEPSR